MTNDTASTSSIGIIAGSGVLPFAVAESLKSKNIRPVIFAIRGFCDPSKVEGYKHHWVALGQFGRLAHLIRSEHCRDVVFIGGLVRPALSEIRLDFGTLRVIPAIAKAMRGGDDHLLTSIGRIFEQNGFRLRGIKDIAPELLVPEGSITRETPSVDALADIAKGRGLLNAIGPFDVGQAVVVIDGHVIAVEDIEGTDGLLSRVARLREAGRVRAKAGRGVLVKAPKPDQDRRVDLPTLGPKTIDGVVVAGLAGVAIVAGQTLIAEPELTIGQANKAGLFVTGLPA